MHYQKKKKKKKSLSMAFALDGILTRKKKNLLGVRNNPGIKHSHVSS